MYLFLGGVAIMVEKERERTKENKI